MKSLIKCHLNYLISKTTIIVFVIVFLIILIGSMSSVFMLDYSLSYSANNYLYFYNTFSIASIIIILFTIFLFGYSFLSKSDNYVVILIASGVSRIKIIITKIFSISLIILVVCYFAYFQYMLVGFINFKEFIFDTTYLYAFLKLFLLSIFFGLISLILVLKFDNIYTIIIPFALMNLSEVINDDESIIVRVINFIIPNYNELFIFYYGSIHAIILIIILLVVNIYYYDNKDF